MAKFDMKHGVQANYEALAVKDGGTLYFTDDEKNLYKGSLPIVEKVAALADTDLDGGVLEAKRAEQLPTAKAVLDYVTAKLSDYQISADFFTFKGSKTVSELSAAATENIKVGYTYVITDEGSLGGKDLTIGDIVLFTSEVAAGTAPTDADIVLIDNIQLVQAVDFTAANPSTLKGVSEKAVVDALAWGTF